MNSTKVKTNLIQQNCYIRDTRGVFDEHNSYAQDVYKSLDVNQTDNGIVEEVNDYPYFINPEYVQSFVSSTDYRRDPQQAIVAGVHRQNLGDISSLQDISKLDTVAQRALYSQLSAKFGNANRSKVVTDNPSDKEEK